MNAYLYRLAFSGPVHFGALGIGLEKIHHRISSDALLSAVINAFSILGLADEVVAALDSESAPFALSSLFPYGPDPESHQRVYALPKPLSAPPVEKQDLFKKFGKDLKKTAYLTPQDFNRWIGKETIGANDISQMIERSRPIGKAKEGGDETGWWIVEMRPRVALDRICLNSNIWRCGTLHFTEKSGLYGLLKTADDTWLPKLSAAFQLLGEQGIGGERTYGLGMFTFSGFESIPETFQFGSGEARDKFVLLSSYYPTELEMPHLKENLIAWEFMESKGYIVSGRRATTLKRKRVNMLKEGTVLKKPVAGKLVDVTPGDITGFGIEHHIYRSGIAYIVPEGKAS